MKPNSIITRRKPENDGYDVCRVVSHSPLTSTMSEWPSSGGHSMIVSPMEFGENKIMPIDYIMANFEIEDPVEPEDPTRAAQVPYTEQPSPEQVFAAEARKNPPRAREEPKPLTKQQIAEKRAATKSGAA